MKKILLLLAMTLMAAFPTFAAEVDYMCFTAQEDNSSIRFDHDEYQKKLVDCNILTSSDKKTWTTYKLGTTIKLKRTQKIYFKGDYYGNKSYCNQFYMTGKIAASGNIMTLTDGDKPTKSLKGKDYAFSYLFLNCKSLTTPPQLPATVLAEGCYSAMFSDCTSLTKAPELPAKKVEEYCYKFMFRSCTSLKTAPKLPATTLARYCYDCMFHSCSSLTTPPELPATELAESCYSGMFNSCSSLKTAPKLPVTTLTEYCYYAMFYCCTSLTTAPELPATVLADGSYELMFYNCKNLKYIKVAFTHWYAKEATDKWVTGVAPKGTFVCPEKLPQTIGEDNIPKGWTIKSNQASGITPATLTPSDITSPTYDLRGQEVPQNHKGIIIRNHKKIIQK